MNLCGDQNSAKLEVRSPFNLAFDVVTLAEERKPIVQHFLVLV